MEAPTPTNHKQQYLVIVLCAFCIIITLLLIGNSTIRENPFIKYTLLAFIAGVMLYFFITNGKHLKTAGTEWARDQVRKRNPDILFPGDLGYEEALKHKLEQEKSPLSLQKEVHK